MVSAASSKSASSSAVDNTALLAPTAVPSPPTKASFTQWQRFAQRAAFIGMSVSSVFVALLSYRYLIPAAQRTLPPDILANLFARPFLYIHAGCAATALIVGPFQFSRSLRRRYLNVHRILGRLYVLSCLVGGLAAMPIALASTAGPIVQSGLFVLAIFWLVINSNGWRLAVAGRIAEHKAWMVRSFALTFAAVTLRLTIVMLPRLGVSFMTAYRLSAWSAWVPNLLLVEAWMWYNSTAGGGGKAVQPAERSAAANERNSAELTAVRD